MFNLEPNLFAWLILGFMTVTTGVSYIPQGIQLVKTKSSDDINALSWWIWLSQYTAMTVYVMFFTDDLLLTLLYVFETSLCLTILILVYKYKSKRKNKRVVK